MFGGGGASLAGRFEASALAVAAGTSVGLSALESKAIEVALMHVPEEKSEACFTAIARLPLNSAEPRHA